MTLLKELLHRRQRFRRRETIVFKGNLQFTAIDPAGIIDLLDRELHA
jgi:hypothetical protein